MHFAESIETVQANLREVQPTILFGVPRIWEKVLARSDPDRLGAPGSSGRTAGSGCGVATGSATTLVRTGGRHTVGTRLRYAIGWLFFFRALRDRIGMRKVRYAASGAARSRPRCCKFFMGIGVPMHEVYGMTENTAIATANRPGRVKLGTVGEPHPGVELRIDERPARSSPGTRARSPATGATRGDARTVDRRRLAAHRRRRRVGGRHARADHRPDEGHHHHRGRQERRAVARSRTRSRPRRTSRRRS